MKTQLLLIFLLTCEMTTFIQAQDISTILMDRRYAEKQIDCLLDRGPCDIVGKQIRGLLPELMNNNCRRCTLQQVGHARKLIEFMQRRYPNEWNFIVQRYARVILPPFDG